MTAPEHPIQRAGGRIRRRTSTVLVIAAAALSLGVPGWVIAASAGEQTDGPAGTAASPIQVPGGTVLPIRAAGRTGDLGVTFGTSGGTVNGGPYDGPGVNADNPNFNKPMFKSSDSDLAAFWDEYVGQLLSAGFDYVAYNLRGYTPGNPPPPTGFNVGGDPRLVGGLVDAIKRQGAKDKLKIAALDDTAGSLFGQRNLVNHEDNVPFDVGDADGTGNGGYNYFWEQNQRVFFQLVPDDMRYKIDNRPVIWEWSMNPPAFTNQYGNLAKLLQYARGKAQQEFGVNPYYIVDHSWIERDPTVVAKVDGIHKWFGLDGGHTVNVYRPIADDNLLTYSSDWASKGTGAGGDYQGGVHTTSVSGASVPYSFYGTGVEYLAATGTDQGSTDVYVDNQLKATVSLRSDSQKTQQPVYRISGLPDGPHTIKIVNKAATPVNVDGFHVLSGQPSTVAGRSYGVLVPGFTVTKANMVIDPQHGKTYTSNLQNTVNAGADYTLVEGMTDWEENALVARTAEGSYDQRHTDYPGQMLGITRQFSKTPFPAVMKVEAETADSVTGASPGNNGVYRDGDIDVERSGGNDAGGWDVGYIQNNEALTWQNRPLQGTVNFTARIATPNDGSQVRFVVDGVPGPVVNVPNTGGWQNYTTVDGGTFQFASATYHTVTMQFPQAGLNANYWTATTVAPPAPPRPATISLKANNGKFVAAENAGASALIANRTVVGSWEKFDVTYLSGDRVQLKARANGKFVTAENAGASPLIANRNTASLWETFRLIANADGTFSLLAEVNNKFVTSNNGAYPLIADRLANNGWERFIMSAA
jgi:hypothetical protein